MKLIKLANGSDIENDITIDSARGFSYEAILSFSQQLMPEWSDQLALAFNDVDFSKSIVASSNGELVGILLVSDRQVKNVLEEAEIIEQKTDLKAFESKTGMEGVLFLIHPNFRGTGLDKKLVSHFKGVTACNYMYKLLSMLFSTFIVLVILVVMDRYGLTFTLRSS